MSIFFIIILLEYLCLLYQITTNFKRKVAKNINTIEIPFTEVSNEEYIEYLANQSNEICMNNGNSKTGKACLGKCALLP